MSASKVGGRAVTVEPDRMKHTLPRSVTPIPVQPKGPICELLQAFDNTDIAKQRLTELLTTLGKWDYNDFFFAASLGSGALEYLCRCMGSPDDYIRPPEREKMAIIAYEHNQGTTLDFLRKRYNVPQEPLMLRAAFEGNLEMLKVLCDNNYRKVKDVDYIIAAICGGHKRCVKYLLHQGFDYPSGYTQEFLSL